LNLGAPDFCTAVPVGGIDQRGIVRPYGAGCDLGATEATEPGGRGFKLSATTVDLTWAAGNAATAIHVLRLAVAPAGPTATFGPLPAGATSYTDSTGTGATLYCYLAVPADSGSVLAVSDVLCTQSGLRGGAPAPAGFTVRLDQSETATLTWAPPVGGVDSYVLLVLPGDGSPPTSVPLAPAALTTTYNTGGEVTCFLLFGVRTAPPTPALRICCARSRA